MTRISSPALVLFSGGQDSTTCLAWALDRFSSIETVGFNYGQRHAAELDARPVILEHLRTLFPQWQVALGGDCVLPLDLLRTIGGSALTARDSSSPIETGASGLPTSFVPGRNILFLAAAAALAWRQGIRHLVGGMCEMDYSGYPDCRNETIKAVGRALDLGLDAQFTIHTPLMYLDKEATWLLAEEIGGSALVELIVDETVTCYEGCRTLRHPWGHGCGVCPACVLRARGYERYAAG
jgi:7-cyano-7-deazaguanine synthase